MEKKIREKRLTVLKKGYQNPTIVNFSFNNSVSGECSDMCSPNPCDHNNGCRFDYIPT